jgi:hypothetical protein
MSTRYLTTSVKFTPYPLLNVQKKQIIAIRNTYETNLDIGGGQVIARQVSYVG